LDGASRDLVAMNPHDARYAARTAALRIAGNDVHVEGFTNSALVLRGLCLGLIDRTSSARLERG